MLIVEVLQYATSDDTGRTIAAWEQGERAALARAQRLLQELADAKAADLAMLSVALRELRNLA